MDGNKARGVQFVARPNPESAGDAGRGGGRGGPALTAEQQNSLERGGAIYTRVVLRVPRRRRTRHADARRGGGSTLAPSLAGSPRVNGHRDYVIKAVLHGLSGPIDGKTYPQVMVPMGSNKDQWIADVASYVRNSFGNTGAFVTLSRRRAGSRGHRRSKDAVDGRRARGVAAAPARADADLESHGQPRRAAGPAAERRGRLQLSSATPAGALSFHGLDDRRAAAGRHVVPDRAAGAVTLTEIQFTSSTVGGGRAGSPPVVDVPARLSGPGLDRRHDLERPGRRRPGHAGHDRHHVCAGQREVRADHTDGDRRRRAALVDAAAAALRGAEMIRKGIRHECLRRVYTNREIARLEVVSWRAPRRARAQTTTSNQVTSRIRWFCQRAGTRRDQCRNICCRRRIRWTA